MTPVRLLLPSWGLPHVGQAGREPAIAPRVWRLPAASLPMAFR